MVRENQIRENANSKNDALTETSIYSCLLTFRNLISESFKKFVSNENIERYKDMQISQINEVYQDVEEEIIDHYTYDVIDNATGDFYTDLISRSSDVYAVGDMVRVYISNIIYIGVKI